MTDDVRAASRGHLRNSNSALRAQVDELLDGLQQQTRALAEAQESVAAATAEAESPDGAVRVTVDAGGAVVSVHIDPAAFARTTPERLAESVAAAARAAATDVREKVVALLAPVTALGPELPDLPDLVPGAPSIRQFVPTVATEFATDAPAAAPDPEGDDLHDWRAPIMREAHRG